MCQIYEASTAAIYLASDHSLPENEDPEELGRDTKIGALCIAARKGELAVVDKLLLKFHFKDADF